MDALATMPAAALILGIFWLWGRIERAFDRRNLSQYRPVPIPSKPTFTSNQVSIVVCTVDTLLVRCLNTWLANNPLEIIIVTIPQYKRHIHSVISNASLSPLDHAKITVLESPTKGKRAQLATGIQHAKGEILATVDDHISWHPSFLTAMLPCFDDAKVGAIGPTCKPIIPAERQHSNIITPWEVAAMRTSWHRNDQLKAAYAAARWCWVLAGVTGVFRAHILQDPAFIEGYTNDCWRGKKLDVGEDTFISRWLQSHGWIIAIQALPETEVRRTAKKCPDYLKQMFRWERSTIQSHIRTVLEVPQIYESVFVARKTWGRVLRPLLTTCHLLAWVIALGSGGCSAGFAVLLVALYAGEAWASLRDFFAEHPYMLRYWWAAVGQDFFYVVQDYWCWMTLDNTHWESRTVSAEDQHKRE